MPETYLPSDPERSPFRIAIKASIVLVPLIGFFLWAASNTIERGPVIEGDLLSATVVAMRSLDGESGSHVYLIVQIQDGREVRVDLKPGVLATVGSRVLVRELAYANGSASKYRLERLE